MFRKPEVENIWPLKPSSLFEQRHRVEEKRHGGNLNPPEMENVQKRSFEGFGKCLKKFNRHAN